MRYASHTAVTRIVDTEQQGPGIFCAIAQDGGRGDQATLCWQVFFADEMVGIFDCSGMELLLLLDNVEEARPGDHSDVMELLEVAFAELDVA